MERFVLKIAAKRQVTMPVRLLELLHVVEGDMVEFSVEENSLTGRGLKLIPSSLFTEELLSDLRKRELELDEHPGADIKNMNQISAELRGSKERKKIKTT